ncbi:MAG: hypothetical protein GY789_03140 [Hyphomicrobiales bacterium]|nr:hypothetical protein [Hyphomicrobiales bacterium]
MRSATKMGFVLLSAPRSGTSWLGSLTNAYGTMGVFNEWFGSHMLSDIETPTATCEDILFPRSLTDNNRFCAKVFAHQYAGLYRQNGTDLLWSLKSQYDVSFFMLERKDRLRQAISHVRAIKSGNWSYKNEQPDTVRYDFEQIASAYFKICKAYDFWRFYLEMRQIPHQLFYYVDLIDDAHPYVQAVAAALDLPQPQPTVTDYKIQRDTVTEQWFDRFQDDFGRSNIIDLHDRIYAPSRNAENLARFFRKQGFRTI